MNKEPKIPFSQRRHLDRPIPYHGLSHSDIEMSEQHQTSEGHGTGIELGIGTAQPVLPLVAPTAMGGLELGENRDRPGHSSRCGQITN